MYAFPRKGQSIECLMVQAEKAIRVLFVIVVVGAGSLLWLAPHPPMIDLPQHAAQVAVLHDLLLGQSPWQGLLRINLFTPYLIGYGLALALSFLMPVAVALKLVLTLAYYGFVGACVLLRKRVGGDARLDWLFVPGFFGFAYEFGFFTFLVAAPLGVLFVSLAWRYADRPSVRSGAILLISGIGMFFSHGLLFLFVNAIGVALVVVELRRSTRISLALWPYALLGALCVAYALVHRDVDLKPLYPAMRVLWRWDWYRPVLFLGAPWGMSHRAVPFIPVSLFMLVAPWIIGLRVKRESAALAPMGVVILVWLSVPSFALNTGFLFERFALFVFPFYALMFRHADRDSAGRPIERARALLCSALLASACIAFLGVQARHAADFATESADFDSVMAATEPAQRALTIIVDKRSPATGIPAYTHFPAWYQAERRGLIDFNFAWFPPQIVRYRLDRLPAVRPVDIGQERRPFYTMFDWTKYQAQTYRYFFVREGPPLPRNFFDNNHCGVVLLKAVGRWAVYERQICH